MSTRVSSMLAVSLAMASAAACAPPPRASGEGNAATAAQSSPPAPHPGPSGTPAASSSPPAVASSAAPTAPEPVSSSTPAAETPAAARLAVELVARMPEVKRYCASLERAPQPSHCAMWPEEPADPKATCSANAAFTDDCLWPVYLGESHPDHSVRFATLYVNPTTRAVVAVSDFVCGLMPVATWRKWNARQASASPDKGPECPDSSRH